MRICGSNNCAAFIVHRQPRSCMRLARHERGVIWALGVGLGTGGLVCVAMCPATSMQIDTCAAAGVQTTTHTKNQKQKAELSAGQFAPFQTLCVRLHDHMRQLTVGGSMHFRKLDGFRYSLIHSLIHSLRGALVATEASSALERLTARHSRHGNVLPVNVLR